MVKLPDQVRQELVRMFFNQKQKWLIASSDVWPLEIPLGLPTEEQAKIQPQGLHAWITAWNSWGGPGLVQWRQRQWRTLGTQELPSHLKFSSPDEVASCVGESSRWERASSRYKIFVQRWPQLAGPICQHFDVLSDYSHVDIQRLFDMLSWLESNPSSGLYLRQLPVSGLDTKWLDSRKGLVASILAKIRIEPLNETPPLQFLGLKELPRLVRIRILDKALRAKVGGISDITAPLEEISSLGISPSQVLIVENLQTGLALPEGSACVVFMRLGYQVDALSAIPWIRKARCRYWGDLDTHGFAILSRARAHLPDMESVLMNEDALLSHRTLWTTEDKPSPASQLPFLSTAESSVHQSLKQHTWGQNIRLEQERIQWDYALEQLSRTHLR